MLRALARRNLLSIEKVCMINIRIKKCFTLVELIVVLAIISIIVSVVLPFAGRSNEGLKIKEQSRDIAETIKYAQDFAQKSHKQVKFIIDTKDKSYQLQVADEKGIFNVLESSLGTIRYIDQKVVIADIDGFTPEDQKLCLIFDYKKPWPKASLSISTKDLQYIIKINGRKVSIEEISI
jgi:prepilin-type N-terminal cleavage/methylation domain-containing protein